MIVHVRPDRCLDILDIVEGAQVSQACERLQDLPLTGREPFKFRYGGKWCSFQATYKWPLIGVCQPDKETLLLLSIVGAGLMITGVWEEGYQSISVEDWRLPFDLGGPTPHTRAPRTGEQPRAEAAGEARGRSRGIAKSKAANDSRGRGPGRVRKTCQPTRGGGRPRGVQPLYGPSRQAGRGP